METSNYQAVEAYLSKNYMFRYNVVLNRIEYKLTKGKQFMLLDDYILNSILRSLKKVKVKVSRKDLIYILNSDFVAFYDPIKEYFAALKVWTPDMPDYIGQLTKTVYVLQDDEVLWSSYLQKWLIATVACALDVEKVNQTVLVFVGNQGIGKTTWMERLVPKELSTYYFSGTINPNDKDTKINLSECFLINLDELENLNRTEVGSLKQLITETSIRIRRPYAAMAEKMARRASFMGSVNNTEFLKDDTGNRRFLCVDAKRINYQHKVNIDMVYAQAYHLYMSGTRYWFNYEENCAVTQYNERFKAQRIEIELVNKYFEPSSNEKPDTYKTVSELKQYLLLRGEHASDLNLNRLGAALKMSAYTKTKIQGRWLYKLDFLKDEY